MSFEEFSPAKYVTPSQYEDNYVYLVTRKKSGKNNTAYLYSWSFVITNKVVQALGWSAEKGVRAFWGTDENFGQIRLEQSIGDRLWKPTRISAGLRVNLAVQPDAFKDVEIKAPLRVMFEIKEKIHTRTELGKYLHIEIPTEGISIDKGRAA